MHPAVTTFDGVHSGERQTELLLAATATEPGALDDPDALFDAAKDVVARAPVDRRRLDDAQGVLRRRRQPSRRTRRLRVSRRRCRGGRWRRLPDDGAAAVMREEVCRYRYDDNHDDPARNVSGRAAEEWAEPGRRSLRRSEPTGLRAGLMAGARHGAVSSGCGVESFAYLAARPGRHEAVELTCGLVGVWGVPHASGPYGNPPGIATTDTRRACLAPNASSGQG